MLTRITTAASLALLVSSGAAAADQPSQSATIAKELAGALTAGKLEAVAAKDPEQADRFIAALFYPGGELLVVSARYPAPALLDARLTQKQYRDVYLDLFGSSIAGSKIFYQDMSADGLCASRNQLADTVDDGSGTPKIFDGDGSKQKLSDDEYRRQYAAADRQYARLLQILLAQVKPQT